MADSKEVFTHCALLIFLVSKLPFCNFLWIWTVWILCCPFMHDLAHVHPNSCSSSGCHQLSDSPWQRGTGCYSTAGCTNRGISHKTRCQSGTVLQTGSTWAKHRHPVWQWIAKLWNQMTGHPLEISLSKTTAPFEMKHHVFVCLLVYLFECMCFLCLQNACGSI